MKSKFYTNTQESKRLLALGANPCHAEWVLIKGKPYTTDKDAKYNDPTCIPCWTIRGLINTLPKRTRGLMPKLPKDCSNAVIIPGDYSVYQKGSYFYCTNNMHTARSKTLFGAIYNMLCWMLENNNKR